MDAAKAKRAASKAGIASKISFMASLEQLRTSIGPRSVQLVVAEPYMRQWEGSLPWHHVQSLSDSLYDPHSPLPELIDAAATILPTAGMP